MTCYDISNVSMTLSDIMTLLTLYDIVRHDDTIDNMTLSDMMTLLIT